MPFRHRGKAVAPAPPSGQRGELRLCVFATLLPVLFSACQCPRGWWRVVGRLGGYESVWAYPSGTGVSPCLNLIFHRFDSLSIYFENSCWFVCYCFLYLYMILLIQTSSISLPKMIAELCQTIFQDVLKLSQVLFLSMYWYDTFYQYISMCWTSPASLA